MKINKRDILTFIIIFIMTCIIFLPFLKGHYATDTYNIANVGYHNYAINWSLKDGRILMSIIGLIAEKINISIENYVFFTLFIALIISNIAVITLNKIIKKYKQPKSIIQEIILILASYVTIFNFMYLENMYYVESIVMAISVLLFIISANILIQKNKLYFIKSLLLTIIGVMCYQGTIGLFFAFTILFTILKNKGKPKQIIIDLIKSGIIALIAVILNIVLVKIICNIFKMQQNRLGNIKNIFNNIKVIILTMPKILINTCNLFPKSLLVIFLSLLTLILIIYQTKNLKENIIYKYFSIVIITILGSCTTYILTLTSFYTGRLRNALGALLGIIFLFIYRETDLFDKKKILNLFTYIVFIAFFIINTINYEYIMLQHKQVNKLEKEQVQKLDQYINQYEEKLGIKVKKIAIVPILNNSDKAYFDNIKNKTSLTHNALKTSWASDGIINFYTNRKLETIGIGIKEKNLYLQKYDKNLEYQCIEDILYVNIYMY